MNRNMKWVTLVTTILFLTTTCISPVLATNSKTNLEKTRTLNDVDMIKLILKNIPSDTHENTVTKFSLTKTIGMPNLYLKNPVVLRVFINLKWYYMIRVTVCNEGQFPCGPTTVCFWIDNIPLGCATTLGLPGSSYKYAYSKLFQISPGCHKITICVDYYNVIKESNEEDNCITFIYCV